MYKMDFLPDSAYLTHTDDNFRLYGSGTLVNGMRYSVNISRK